MSKIPIENIYYIILYAWNKTNHKKIIVDRGLEDINTINDVILELFLLEVSKIAKKGLYGEYIDNNYDTDYIKGKVNIKESIYLINPKMNCRYDEFSKNNILNKILKVILNKIYFTKNINNKFKRRIRSLLLEFYEVDNILLDESHFKLVRYNKLNQDYIFSIDLAYLIHRNCIPIEDDLTNKFIDINRDKERMSSIFEEFLRNFYKKHTNYNISRRKYNWDLEPIENSNIHLIPKMETDIEIEKDDEKIIIDAKYYNNAFTNRYDVQKFIPSNMYQITAYLRKNINKNQTKKLRGILIYPSNGYDFHEKFSSKEGYIIEFKTINLNKKWYKIKEELLSIF